ncbi:MAG: hypothetical protein KGL39_24430 [Patescibacteria group bacterium]|nr:hypothetical protein [Patescibacteria group bacterium]
MTRSDFVAPKNYDPSEYEVIDYLDNKRPEFVPGVPVEFYEKAVAVWRERIFEHFPDFQTGGDDHTSIHQCNHCGHPAIRWVAVVLHKPTGKKLAFGEICAERVDMPGRDAFKAKFIKDRAALEQARLENEARKAAFRADNADVCEFLDGLDTETAHPFLCDMVYSFNRKGELTEGQTNAVKKFMVNEQRFQQRKQEQAEAMKDVPPVVEGRRTVEGEIVTVKPQEGDYGTTWKMLVLEADGNKVWSTIPERLWTETWDANDGSRVENLLHCRVRFDAEITRSCKDEHFGLAKRPTKAQVTDKSGAEQAKLEQEIKDLEATKEQILCDIAALDGAYDPHDRRGNLNAWLADVEVELVNARAKVA